MSKGPYPSAKRGNKKGGCPKVMARKKGLRAFRGYARNGRCMEKWKGLPGNVPLKIKKEQEIRLVP